MPPRTNGATDCSSGLASNNVTALAVVGDLDEILVVSNDGVTVAGPDPTFMTRPTANSESKLIGSIGLTAWSGYGDGAPSTRGRRKVDRLQRRRSRRCGLPAAADCRAGTGGRRDVVAGDIDALRRF